MDHIILKHADSSCWHGPFHTWLSLLEYAKKFGWKPAVPSLHRVPNGASSGNGIMGSLWDRP